MGRAERPKSIRLPEKLLQIRKELNYSQNEMLRALELSEKSYRSAISGYELGTKQPPLPTLLKYAELAGICTDILINDNLDLPSKIPSTPNHSNY